MRCAFDISAFVMSERELLLKFDMYGVWKITTSYSRKLEIEEVEMNDEELKKYHEITVDIVRHEVYIPRQHFFIFKLKPDLDKTVYLLLMYDGSSASASLLLASISFRRVLSALRQETEGLDPRYD